MPAHRKIGVRAIFLICTSGLSRQIKLRDLLIFFGNVTTNWTLSRNRNRAVIARPGSLCYTFFVRGTWPCMTYAIFATSYQISDAKKDCRSRRSRKCSAFRRRRSRNGSAEFHIVKDTTPTTHAYKYAIKCLSQHFGRVKAEAFYIIY